MKKCILILTALVMAITLLAVPAFAEESGFVFRSEEHTS